MVQMRMEGFKKIRTSSTCAKDEEMQQQVIETDGTNSSVSSVDQKISDWRIFMYRVFESNRYQIGIVCLVIFACLLVISELMIDLHIFKEMPDARLLLHKVLHYATIAVFALFLCEVLVKVAVMRCRLFRDKMELFDCAIVICVFTLYLMLTQRKHILSGVGLVIVLRLWRVTKILNGIIASIKLQADRSLSRERRNREAIEMELAKFREYCQSQEIEIQFMKSLLNKHGICLNYQEKTETHSRVDVVADINKICYEKMDCPQDVRDAIDTAQHT